MKPLLDCLVDVSLMLWSYGAHSAFLSPTYFPMASKFWLVTISPQNWGLYYLYKATCQLTCCHQMGIIFYTILPGATLRLVWRFQHMLAFPKHPVSLKAHINWTIPRVQVMTPSSLTFHPDLCISPVLRQLAKCTPSRARKNLETKDIVNVRKTYLWLYTIIY